MMISSVTKIKDCPSFIDFRPESDLPEFKKYNLIYGWNGSGKTSFSRIIRSFELGSNYYAHPERSPIFEFKLNNGKCVNQLDLTSFPNIRVFNKDFINESVFGIDGPKPIFFLGKESKEDKENIMQIDAELQSLKKNRDLKKELLEKVETNKAKMLSEKARDIKNTLTTSRSDKYRNYERPNLESEIKNKSKEFNDFCNLILEEDHLVALQNAIQETTKPPIETLRIPNFDISDIIFEARSILQKTATSQIIEGLKEDNKISKWVEQGLFIHQEKKSTTCIFCNQAISKNRLKDLENHFNDEYRKLIEKLGWLKSRLVDIKVKVEFPDTSKFYDELVDQFSEKKKEVETIIKTFNQNLDKIISIIEQKEQNPYLIVSLDNVKPTENISFSEINEIITKHNKKTDNFDSQIEKSKKMLELHYIAEFVDTYNDIISESKILENEYLKFSTVINDKEREIRKLKARLTSHHTPAQQINSNLEQFLGRSDIQIRASDEQDGYKITRNGERIGEKNLSEGEKTALAIVYFLTKINEQGFDLQSSVIVIDDPVSSLDSSAIFQAFSFMKESIKNAKQIFILTHHFDYFRQVKNWFSYCAENDREYFMIVCDGKDLVRKSSIVKIDKLLIDYESEYHFLFSILYKIAKEQKQHLKEMYPIPNIARKFLESFLAFRVPVVKGGRRNEPALFYRLGKIDFNPKKKERIYRFIETHSHPRYETGVQDFDMTLLGETSDILNDLLELLKYEDEKHYKLLEESIKTD